jgi:hypothetical protein
MRPATTSRLVNVAASYEMVADLWHRLFDSMLEVYTYHIHKTEIRNRF